MKQLKVLLPDTKCLQCGWTVNRRRAEANDWTEVVYVDHTGMPLTKAFICQNCIEDPEVKLDIYKAPEV